MPDLPVLPVMPAGHYQKEVLLVRSNRSVGMRVLIVLSAVAVLATACSPDSAPTTTAAGGDVSETTTAGGDAGGFNWRQFEGEEIRVLLNQHPWQEAIEPLIPEFEALTGITVEVEKLPEEQFRQRVLVELTAGSDDLDVFMTSLLNEGAKFSKNGWYTDLRQFAENPSLTAPEFGFTDFGEVLLNSHTYDNVLVGLPIQLETQMLYYRKDIFEAAGVEVPKTLAEMETVAQAIDDPDGVRAFVARGKGRAAVTQISSYLYNFGGNWTEPGSFDAAFNSPEGLAAFDFYTRMLREYGPKGTAGMSWEEALPLFQQGQVAMYTDASVFVNRILEGGAPEVVDNLGFAPMPSGPGGEFQTFFGWAIGMSAFTEMAEPSWYFIQWATSPEIVQRITKDGGVVGGRAGVEFPEELPAEWVAAFTSSLPHARPQLPAVIPVSEVRDVIGVAVIVGIEGGDLAAALAEAEKAFNETVARAGG